MKLADRRGGLELSDLVVLELGERTGVSVAGSVLAQLGATVIFVERGGGPRIPDGKASCRAQFAAGKRSLVWQRGRAEDRRLLADLARRADVLLMSSDVDDAELSELPAFAATAVVCDVSTFGNSGPCAGQSLSDVQVQALTGILACTGTPDSGPVPMALPLVEYMAGLYAAGGVLCALRLRASGGGAQPVEVALYDVGFSAMTSFLAPAFEGLTRGAARVGNRHPMAAPWNVYRAVDGWVLLCAGSDEQWRRICGLVGRPELADAPGFAKNVDRVAHVAEVDGVVQGWVGARTVDECVQRLCSLGLPCGPVARMDAFPHEANLVHRGMVQAAHDPVADRQVWIPGSAFRSSRIGVPQAPRIPAPDADRAQIEVLARSRPRGPIPPRVDRGDAARPLAGLRVLEIGHYTTVPLATRTLAALGAEVIKIEPPEGEAVRFWPPARHGQGIFYTFQNSDKKSVCLELDSEPGRLLLRRLIASADVLVENLRPGALARKGFSPQDVARINPRLVYCSISGFGADSLYPGRAAFDSVVQAMSGLMDVTHVAGVPLKTGPSSADLIGAAFGFVAIVAALARRDAGDCGEFVDIAMQDVVAWATQTVWNGARRPQPPPVVARADAYVLGDGAGALPILCVDEVLVAPQTLARGLWSQGELDGFLFPLLAIPLRLPGAVPAPMRPGPPLGRDNTSIEHSLAPAGCNP